MKKFLLTMVCAMMSLAGMAQMTKPFVDNLVVTINGESTEPQETTVYLTLNEDNTCDFALNNFMLSAGDDNYMPVGNIRIAGLPLSLSEEGYYTFSYDGNLLISAGDAPGCGEDDWLGPLLGEIPLKLKGKATMDKVYVTIDIDMMETIEQIIYVTFGTDDFAADLGMPFTDDLVVTINGESTDPQQTTVYLSLNEDNSCNFTLKNFMLDGGDGNYMPVGNIALKNLPLALSDEGYYTFSYDGNLLITAGDAPGFTEEDWLGPLLGEIPLKLKGKATMEKVYVTIDIDMMETIEQIIYVTFGSDFEASNPPATTYALTFVVDGQTVSTAELEAGAAITYPQVAQKEGYTFAWEGETVATMPAEALTIKGGYTVNTYTLNYYVNDRLVHSEEVEYGAAIDVLSLELLEGYTLSAWDEVPATMPAHDVDVHATETVNSYTVTYKDGDKVIATYKVNYGEAMPEAPAYSPESDDRYTRTFLGWDGEQYTTMPAYDVVYTAKVDIVDAIRTIMAGQAADAYDLQGRRVVNPRKGLYIMDGRKVLK